MKFNTILAIVAALPLSVVSQIKTYEMPDWVFYADGTAGVATSEISLLVDLNVSPPTDGGLAKSLESLPSVAMLRRGRNSMEPSIRGFTGGQITTLFNGLLLPEGSPTRTGSAINLFGANSVSKVKVEMAIASVDSGLSNIGGRISIDSYPILADGLSGTYSRGQWFASYSSSDSGISTGLKYHFNQPGSAYSVGLEYRENDDYRAGNGTYVDADYAAYVGDFSTAWRLSDHQRLYAALHWTQQDLVRNSSLPMDLRGAAGFLMSVKHEVLYDSSKWTMSAGYGTYEHPLDTDDRTVPPILTRIHTDMNSDTFKLGIEYQRYLDGWEIKSGVDFQYLFREARRVVTTASGVDKIDTLWPEIESQSIGYFWQGTMLHNVDSEWRMGIRIDRKSSDASASDAPVPLPVAKGDTVLDNYRVYNENALGDASRDEWMGRINLVHSRKLNQFWISTTGVTYSVTDPVLSKRYRSFVAALGGDGSGGNAFEIGNPWLALEKKMEGSTQLVFKNERLTFHTDAYLAYVWDYAARKRIVTAPASVFGFREDDIRIFGADVQLNYVFSEGDLGRFSVPVSVSWAQGESLETGVELAEIAPLEVVGGLHWESGYPQTKLKVGLDVRWTGSKDNPRPLDVPIYLSTNASTLCDLRIAWQFSEWGQFVCGVDNLFDKLAYHYLQPPVATGPTPSSGNLTAGDAIPLPGRDLFLRAVVRF